MLASGEQLKPAGTIDDDVIGKMGRVIRALRKMRPDLEILRVGESHHMM